MTTTMTDETWIELFIVELRVRHVPGPAIGDAVASVRELTADSGIPAVEQFGSARAYADSLNLPQIDPREQRLTVVFLPVMGLFAFLVSALAGLAWANGDAILLTGIQVLVLSVPIALTLLFALPFYPRAVARRRWLPALLVLLAGASGATCMLLAPQTVAEAWIVAPALPVFVGAFVVLVALSIVNTVLVVRGSLDDEIIDPSHEDRTSGGRGRTAFLLFVAWLFPLLALVTLALTWGMNALRG